ncbi:hypothetical protein QZH41_005317 [Actinostola sp. cb2023]|nr:hypothetical protein QZH41_005317 [Actinostola sp. cb2023]
MAQGREINVNHEKSSRILFNNCSPNDRCLPNPCLNAGRCSQRLNESKCDCSHTNFRGNKCQIPAYSGKENCQDWKTIGWSRDGYYMISPNNIKPFPIFCKMRNVKEPVAIITHTNTGKQVRAIRPSTRKGGFYFHPVRYAVDLASIRALIAESTHCRQHLRYNCLNSVLFDSPRDFELERGRGARWISRDGRTMDYWAGATPGSKKCACGLTGTCVRDDLVCNCDVWDGVWRRDEGYIIDPSALPVTNIKFSVRGVSKSSNFTLGDLECFGKKASPTKAATTTTRTTTPTKEMTSSSTLNKKESTNKASVLTTTPSTTKTANTSHAGKEDKEETKQPSTYGPPFDNPRHIIIIESQGKYITIRQNDNQELILIILSVILAVFIIAIIVLMIKQNLFLPCKCIEGPAYRDVSHVDSVELGPPSSLFTNVDNEIVEYEASPYPPRGINGVLSNASRRDHESTQVLHILESNSMDDTDRLHLSGGSTPSNSDVDDKEDYNKNKCDSPEYEDIECLEMVLMKSPQHMIEVEVEKLKEALYEVISASEVNINNNPITKEIRDDVIFMQEDENFNRTSTIGSMQFCRPPSYQDIEGACSSSQETHSDSTHAQSSRSSATSSWDENSDYENMDLSVLDAETLNQVNHYSNSPSFNHCTVEVISIDKDDHIPNNDHYVNMYEPPDCINTDENSTHSQNCAKESEPLLSKTSSTNLNTINGVIHRNEPINVHYDVDGDVRDDLLAQSDSETMETNAGHDDSDFRSSDSETSK